MVIPESLIKFEKEGDSAYVEVETKPQNFEKRYIKTGLSDGVNIEIKEGVKKEDKIKGNKMENQPKKQEGTQG
jgi:HlyD family secretion protein